MTKILINNNDNTTLTEFKEFKQFKINAVVSQEESPCCIIDTEVIGKITESWSEVLLKERYEVNPEAIRIIEPAITNLEEGKQLIANNLKYTIIENIEKFNTRITELEREISTTIQLKPEDYSYIAHEVLSPHHDFVAEVGTDYIVSYKILK